MSVCLVHCLFHMRQVLAFSLDLISFFLFYFLQAFECATPVDTTTLLALLPDSFLPLYSRLRKSRLLRSQKMWEWCQNPFCSRMVRAENTKSPGSGDDQKNVIHCECGFSWCEGCKEAVHWPATCAQAAEYRDYVDNKGKALSVTMTVLYEKLYLCQMYIPDMSLSVLVAL